jgi:hypothetical protein
MMASTQPATPDIDTSIERQASGKGHGTLEILEIIKEFNEAGIPSCIVGVSALMYFGARRVRCKLQRHLLRPSAAQPGMIFSVGISVFLPSDSMIVSLF